MLSKWVVCLKGKGHLHEDGTPSKHSTHFPANSVGLLKKIEGGMAIVWLIGRNETWTVAKNEITDLDVHKTGDRHQQKICNICHRLRPTIKFSLNQTNKPNK